jgi:hypothetical protein
MSARLRGGTFYFSPNISSLFLINVNIYGACVRPYEVGDGPKNSESSARRRGASVGRDQLGGRGGGEERVACEYLMNAYEVQLV